MSRYLRDETLDDPKTYPGEAVPGGMESREMDISSDDPYDAAFTGGNPDVAYSIRRDIIKTHLAEADFSDANLSGVSLYAALLSKAVLIKADLSAADLRRAALFGAHISEADLSATKLRRASLFAADLTHSDLRGADSQLGRSALVESKVGYSC